MPLQSSSVLKNTGPKQDLKYWAWANVSPSDYGGIGIALDYQSDSVYFSKYTAASKVAKDGRIVWTVPSASSLTYGIASDFSGQLYTASGETVITKYSASGTVVWSRYINTNGSSSGPGLTVDTSGNVYVATSDADSDAVLFKLNSSGSMVWARKISGITSGFRFVAVDEANDRVYAAGYAVPPSGATEGNLVAFNASGTTQWQKRFGVSEVTGVTFAYSTGVDYYGNNALVTFRFGINGQCPIFKYTKDGALADFTGSGIYGFWGNDDQFGNCFFKVDKTNGNIVTTYRSGSYKKYTNTGSELASGRFTTGYNGWGADVDLDGNMYFIMHRANVGGLICKVKPDSSAVGPYGPFTYSASATSGHYPDNSMQSWEAPASYTIISTSLTSTATSPGGITANPTANFAILRTK